MSLFSSFLHHRDRRRPPEWDGDGPRGRVLLEHPDPRVRELVAQRLGDHGYRVLTCAGPGRHGRDLLDCPLHQEASCPGLDGADAVIVALDLDAHAAQTHIDTVLASVPGRPVIVEPASRLDAVKVAQPHRVYRTTIAPLVRQLHELLSHAHRRSGFDA